MKVLFIKTMNFFHKNKGLNEWKNNKGKIDFTEFTDDGEREVFLYFDVSLNFFWDFRWKSKLKKEKMNKK